MPCKRPLPRVSTRDCLVDNDIRGLTEQLVDTLEGRRDVRALQVRVEQLARGPAVDERQPARVLRAPVQRVEDAALLRVRRLDESFERFKRLDLLAGLGRE